VAKFKEQIWRGWCSVFRDLPAALTAKSRIAEDETLFQLASPVRHAILAYPFHAAGQLGIRKPV
jgi:hypothetical protein